MGNPFERFAVVVIRWGVAPIFGVEVATKLTNDSDLIWLVGVVLAASVDQVAGILRRMKP